MIDALASSESATRSYDDRSDREYFTATRVAEIARTHAIPSNKVTELHATLRKACRLYLINGPDTEDLIQKISPRADALDLYKRLRKIRRMLEVPALQARLRSGLEGARPLADAGLVADRGAELAAMVQAMDSLLEAAKHGSEIDGRVMRETLHDHNQHAIRIAGQTLLAFWVVKLKRASSLQNRGGRRTKALEFLLDCLRYLDPRVKDSWLQAGRPSGNDPLWTLDVVPPDFGKA